MLLHRECFLRRSERIGVRRGSVSSQIQTGAEATTRTGQNHHATFVVDRDAREFIVKGLNELGGHGIQPIWPIHA